MSEDIKIYVSDLAAYNSGIHHGAWIDATQDLDDIQSQVSELLACSPVADAEEYAIHDYEGYRSYQISQYTGLKEAQEVAVFIGEHGEVVAEVLNIYTDIEEAHTVIEENYAGCYSSVADFAAELTEESGDTPERLAPFIDYARMTYDLEVGGDIFTIETGFEEVHIFWNR
ncbi:antirestriction protein ArdA [Gilvimarinus sp. SDUM040013]|uniref:Antirestriction protein ArdA n=1 Tax=Gilvimarinus gilvus TaxID=3058038 RepID=A0ABU4S357_9GAMM|nr:antirestriction protein ArdA [Gilvimarinus sp. SDUM040013]MDO3384469.1 antirestriction protein ArdA [Gilvimarinus sp. SDUM040013]MDX6851595.1 antirestriction protein ArdA [Gilvimarinus sp. SDUM040013]